MAVREVRREALPKAAESTNLITSLVLRAEAVLGYSWLRTRLGIEIGALRDTLQALGIEPFCDHDVKKYKARKARKAEEHAWAELSERARRDGLPSLFGTGSYARARWRTVPAQGLQERGASVCSFSRD